MSSPLLLSLLAVASAALHLRAERIQFKGLIYATKPLTMLILIVLVATANPVVSPVYQKAILAGLVLSLVGDLFLMSPKDRFVPGLLAFLFAHIAYIVAFESRLLSIPVVALMPYIVGGLFLLRLLWPTLGRLRIPVAIYVLAIVIMAGWALAGIADRGDSSAWLSAGGAFLFVISDAALAMNRFVGSYSAAQMVVMSTYFAAQWLIALSVLG